VVAEAETVRMSFLSHGLLLPLLPGCLLARQSLANAPRGSANALVRFLFRNVSGMAFGRCNMMLSNTNPEMRSALLVAECAAHRRRTQPLPARPFVHERFRNVKLVHIKRCSSVISFLLSISDGAAQNFLNMFRRALWRVAKRL